MKCAAVLKGLSSSLPTPSSVTRLMTTLCTFQLPHLGMMTCTHNLPNLRYIDMRMAGEKQTLVFPFSDTLNVFLGQGVGDPAAFLQ